MLEVPLNYLILCAVDTVFSDGSVGCVWVGTCNKGSSMSTLIHEYPL